MPDDDLDPSASTQMFQAFVDQPEVEAPRSGWKWAFAVAVLVIVLLIAWLVLR